MAHIEVIVNQDGTVQVEGVGYQGADCLNATRALEAALGQVKQRREKPEMRQRVTAKAGAK